MKICKRCHQEKSLDQFYKNKLMKKDGHVNICKECDKERIRNRYPDLKSSDKYKQMKQNTYLKRVYGITLEDFNKKFQEQNGCCDICGLHQTELKRILDVDHDHLTQEVRGLLCNNCNTSIGRFNDNIELLEKAIKYLKKYSNKLKIVGDSNG